MYIVISAGPGSSPCHFSAMTGNPMLWLVTAFSYLVCSIECQPSGEATSYGKEFWIAFPEVKSATSSLQYRIYVTNPGLSPVSVTLSAVNGGTTANQTMSLSPESSQFATFGSSYMMQGEGTFQKYIMVAAQDSVGVQVIATEKMDAFTPLPVTSWGKSYVALTYCGEKDGPCQVVIISQVDTQVEIILPAQYDNSISLMDATSPPASQTLTMTLRPGDVYQLQRFFDITGATVSANASFGFISGSAETFVGQELMAGAVLEFLPPISAAGTSFAAFLTPSVSSTIGDYVRIVALSDLTKVYLPWEYQPVQLRKYQYITRRFSQSAVFIESDQPVVVVKYSQSTSMSYPTMTLMPPLKQYLQRMPAVVSKVVGFSNAQQYLVVVGTVAYIRDRLATTFGSTGGYVNLTGTNMAVYVKAFSSTDGDAVLPAPADNSSYVAFTYLRSDEVTVQTGVAFRQDTVNQPCSPTDNSPGDNVDNDCDGQIDEDTCTESNFASYTDCGDIISGYRDVWGKTFTFQVADHCVPAPDSDNVILYVTTRSSTPVTVTVQTPLDTTKVRQVQSFSSTNSYEIFNLTGAAIKGNGSNIILDQALLVTSTDEISVTLMQMCPIGGSNSIMSTRLMPDDVLGREYFAITLCTEDKCQIQVAAVHKGTTEVRIRLKFQTGSAPFFFGSVEYQSGEEIVASLKQFQSLQLQSDKLDMTGTHIMSSKPVSVLSGGRSTRFMKQQVADGFVEQLPPVSTWGVNFIVQSSPQTKKYNMCNPYPCLDYLKVVACTANTVVQVYGSNRTDYTLAVAGDFVEIPLVTDFATVKSSKPILIMQITQEVFVFAVSASIVTPVDHYFTSDQIVIPTVTVVDGVLLVTSDHINPPQDKILFNSTLMPMTTSAALNASFFSASCNKSGYVDVSSQSTNFAFGGHMYIFGNAMAGLFSLAHAVTKINPVCVVQKGVRGDSLDNDCDGQVDEEPCDSPGRAEDVDGDAMMNEDCMLLPTSLVVSSSAEPSFAPTASLFEQTAPLSFTVFDSLTTSLHSQVALSSTGAVLSTSVLISSEITPPVSVATLTSAISLESLSLVTESTSGYISPSATAVESVISTSGHTETLTTPSAPITNGIACGCQCPHSYFSTVLDSSSVQELTASIQKELSVDKDDVSANKRKYISVIDRRPSAQTMGYLGVALIAATIIGIFVLDAGTLTKDIVSCVRFYRG